MSLINIANLDFNPGGGSTPTGKIVINENGTYDVTEKATAEVNVPSTGTFVVPDGLKFAYWQGNPVVAGDWDYSELTDASYLFKETPLNRSIIKNIVDRINWNNVTTINLIFDQNFHLTGDASDILPETWVLGENCYNLGYAFNNTYFEKIGNITVLRQTPDIYAAGLFMGCTHLEEVGVLNFKPYYVGSAFSWCSNLKKIGGIDLTNIAHTSYAYAIFGEEWDESSQTRNLTDITFNGEINCDLYIPSPLLSVESIKSALAAASRTTRSDVQKTLTFDITIVVTAEEKSELDALIASCTTKGWTINGLTLTA